MALLFQNNIYKQTSQVGGDSEEGGGVEHTNLYTLLDLVSTHKK